MISMFIGYMMINRQIRGRPLHAKNGIEEGANWDWPQMFLGEGSLTEEENTYNLMMFHV